MKCWSKSNPLPDLTAFHVRILQVVPGVSPNFGGPSVALTALASCLTSHGIDTTLLTTDADPNGRLEVPLNRTVIRDGAAYVFHHVLRIGGRYGFAPSIGRRCAMTGLPRLARGYSCAAP